MLRNKTRSAAVLVMAAALTSGTAVMASTAHAAAKYPCFGFGSGATFDAAHAAAIRDLNGNFSAVYPPYYTVQDIQQPNGTWSVRVGANCSGMES